MLSGGSGPAHATHTTSDACAGSPLPCRILIVDDNEATHRNFAKILGEESTDPGLGNAPPAAPRPRYAIDFASQGEQALELVRGAIAEGRPHLLAFVAMHMPPGWDGLRTIEELWREHPTLQTVVCTASLDHSLSRATQRLGSPERLLVLQKPFDAVEVEQLARSLCARAQLETAVQEHVEELRRARAAAEAADRAKSTFLSNISHEIRTPLTPILGFAAMMAEEELPRAQQVEYLNTICGSGNYLLRLLSAVLDLAKLEADSLEFELLPFSPAESLRQAMAMLRGQAITKGIGFELVLDGPLPPMVVSDATRLQQILLNLIGNAIKFTSRGQVVVRASSRPVQDRLVDLRVEVEDSGIGIPADKLDRLFSPFSQVDASTARRFGGTGLGLAIARRLARGMGGNIEVRSEEGRGSCFTIQMTLALPDGVAGNPLPAGAGTAGRGPGTRPTVALPLRVLVADDAADSRKLMSRLLQRAGAGVTLACDGGEAMRHWHAAAATGNTFDLVITDLQMPVLDGCELTRELRRAGCTAPILACTASAQPTDHQAVVAAGCDAWITKPLDREQFLAACASLLPKDGAHVAPPAAT